MLATRSIVTRKGDGNSDFLEHRMKCGTEYIELLENRFMRELLTAPIAGTHHTYDLYAFFPCKNPRTFPVDEVSIQASIHVCGAPQMTRWRRSSKGLQKKLDLRPGVHTMRNTCCRFIRVPGRAWKLWALMTSELAGTSAIPRSFRLRYHAVTRPSFPHTHAHTAVRQAWASPW
jgi:hypothetical protein